MESKTILAIDFNNVAYSSYYGTKLFNSHHMNVNAIKGFFYKVKGLKDTVDPDYIVFASDLSRAKTFRRKLFPPYKAQRKSSDPDIYNQMKYISQISALMGIPIINNELYEADDILGMLSKFAEDDNMNMVIASSDRDLYQLVSDYVCIYPPRIGSEIIDMTYLEDHYHLTPLQWIDLKILQGDHSDNIPGIRGIGNKTALELMQRYGSIENIYANLKFIKPSLRYALQSGAKNIDLTRQLVTIVKDYTILKITEETIKRTEPDVESVVETLQEIDLMSMFTMLRYNFMTENEKDKVNE